MEVVSEEPAKEYSAIIQVSYLPLALTPALRTLLHRHDDDAYRGTPSLEADDIHICSQLAATSLSGCSPTPPRSQVARRQSE